MTWGSEELDRERRHGGVSGHGGSKMSQIQEDPLGQWTLALLHSSLTLRRNQYLLPAQYAGMHSVDTTG